MKLLFFILTLTGCVTHAEIKTVEKAKSGLSFRSTEEAEAHLLAKKSCPGCDLKRSELSYSDLRGADLSAANLKGADLNHADLRGANLRGAILVRADLSTGTKLKDADLRDTDLTEANVFPEELKLAKTCGAILPNGQRRRPARRNEGCDARNSMGIDFGIDAGLCARALSPAHR